MGKPNKSTWERLTPERVRAEKGLQQLSDEEIYEVIDTLEAFSIIMTKLYQKEMISQE